MKLEVSTLRIFEWEIYTGLLLSKCQMTKCDLKSKTLSEIYKNRNYRRTIGKCQQIGWNWLLKSSLFLWYQCTDLIIIKKYLKSRTLSEIYKNHQNYCGTIENCQQVDWNWLLKATLLLWCDASVWV